VGAFGVDRGLGTGKGCGVPPVDAHPPVNTAQENARLKATFVLVLSMRSISARCWSSDRCC
jgi:hypothetical protein